MNGELRRSLKVEVDRRRREVVLPAAPRRSWSDADMAAALSLHVERTGRLPGKVDLDSDETLPSRKTLTRRFGSVPAAFEALGIVVDDAPQLRLAV